MAEDCVVYDDVIASKVSLTSGRSKESILS